MAHLVKSGGLEALKDDPFIDFTVKSGDKEWKVHRTTLCGDSNEMVLHCTRMTVNHRDLKSHLHLADGNYRKAKTVHSAYTRTTRKLSSA